MTRNVLNNGKLIKLAGWLQKNRSALRDMTADEAAQQATQELQFPVTAYNLRGVAPEVQVRFKTVRAVGEQSVRDDIAALARVVLALRRKTALSFDELDKEEDSEALHHVYRLAGELPL